MKGSNMEPRTPVTKPSLRMFAPYRQTIIGFFLVSGIVAGMILLVHLFLMIGG